MCEIQTQVAKETAGTNIQVPNEISANLAEIFLKLMRQAVREEIRILNEDLREKDRLLTAQESAKMLAVSPEWLYRNANKLSFTRRLGPKVLRFSQRGIERWIASRASVIIR